MYELTLSRFQNVTEKPLALAATIHAEGAPLVSVLEEGVEKIRECAGTSGEKFAGFSTHHTITPTEYPYVEELTVPASAPYELTLKNTPLIPVQIRVHDVAGAADLTEGVVASGVYSADDATGKLVFHVDEAGKSIVVYYKQQLTVTRAKELFFDTPINQTVPRKAVGVADGEGKIFTSEFDITKDYSTGDLKTGPNGQLTIGGTGAAVGRVIAIPTAESPYLGVEFNILKS